MSRFFRQAGDSDSDSEESDDESMSSGDDAPTQRPAASAAKPAMSRFLRTAGSDSSSSDSDESEDSDSDSDDDARPAKRTGLPLRSDSEDEDSEEDTKAGVRIMSAQERRLADMESTGKAIDNALKINDWVAISNGAYRYLYISLHINGPCQNSTSSCV